MTDLEIDQSHLPRVQEVCQGFAVLEDGALAHNLQEQEIEQYYSSNIQNSQLVQKDIRMARKLQEEEEEERANHRALLSHATRQLEEQDSEYARRIQDEIQRCAEQEARRREQEDEEIAKWIQEEEEQRMRSSSLQETLNDGAGLTPKGACLDMGELQQVLLDEELARRLQEEEGLLLQRSPHPAASPLNSYPEGDFRVAQVAQDEEIARFMQKQEMKSKHQSRELDVPESWRDPRRTAQDRRGREERLDSEGLPSPTEACSLDQQPTIPTSTEAFSLDQQPTIPTSTEAFSLDQQPTIPTSTEAFSLDQQPTILTSTEACSLDQQPTIPTSTRMQAFTMRNIAEDLDPTFRNRRQSTDSLRVAETISGSPACQSPPVCHSGHLEKPAFIPPTKRHSDKSARGKSKEKGNCKQQ